MKSVCYVRVKTEVLLHFLPIKPTSDAMKQIHSLLLAVF